jgi:hypothetical protein
MLGHDEWQHIFRNCYTTLSICCRIIRVSLAFTQVPRLTLEATPGADLYNFTTLDLHIVTERL